MFGKYINELQLAKRLSSGSVFKVWSQVGQKGNRWRSKMIGVKLRASEQVSRRKHPFHIRLVSYSKTINVLTAVLPQKLLIYHRNVENTLCVSIVSFAKSDIIIDILFKQS